MIRVKIELISAVTHDVTEIGTMLICNEDTHGNDRTRGDYSVHLAKRGVTDIRAILAKPLRKAEVKNYPRLTYSVWILIARALKAVGLEKWTDAEEYPESEFPTHPNPFPDGVLVEWNGRYWSTQ